MQNINNNYTDNPLAGFKTFRDAHHNNPSAPFYLNGIGTETQASIETFRKLYNSDEGLPKVTWIVTEDDFSEHPGCSTPTLGAAYTSEVLDILTSDPSIWSKTVFIVNFDENDGLFDHMPPPSVPHKTPDNKVYGKSNISTHNEYYYDTDYSKTEENVDDFVNNASHGLGPRVPCYVISPWSIGGNINSQVFDHTSVLRFLEKVTGVEEPNISTWRREICGDLTSCFDFEKHNDAIDIPQGKSESEALQLKVAAEKEHEKHSTKPGHEREYGYDESGKRTKPQMSLVGLPIVTQNGSRQSCQLPYAPKVDIKFKSDAVMFEFANQGKQGIVYQTYNYLAHNEPQQDKFLAPENSPYDMTMPRQYSVASKGANKLEPTVSDKWTFGDHRDFDLMTFGPNGFIRRVKGLTSEHREMPIVSIDHKESRAGHATPHLSIKIENHSKQTQVITITDNIYGKDPVEFKIKAGKVEHIAYKACKHCWYDLSITADNCEYFSLQAAGRIEMNHKHNFKAVTDPEMGNFSCDNELNSLIS